MEQAQEVLNSAAGAAVKAEKVGGVTAASSGIAVLLTENYQMIGSIGVLVGIVLGVAGFMASQYWNWKKHQLDRKRFKSCD